MKSCSDRCRVRRSLFLMLGLLGAASALSSGATMIDVGANKQLFVDDFLIESRTGVQLVMNPPYQTGELLITGDQPWEKKGNAFVWGSGSVRKEDGKVRLWYQVDCLEFKPQPVGYILTDTWVAYAESEDGVHFRKPKLNLHEVRGSKANNVVMPGVEGCSVWVDPKAPPDRRYRSQTCCEKIPALVFHASPDGIHWTKTHEADIGHRDSQNIIFWDPAVGRYVLNTRTWFAGRDPDSGYRGHRRLESDDLMKWGNEIVTLRPDAADAKKFTPAGSLPPVDYYGACIFKYPDENGVYVMLAEAYWHWYKRKESRTAGPNTFDVRLLTSRDGKTYRWTEGRKPFLRSGPSGSFYSGMIWVQPFPIQMGDELWIYYQGTNWCHEGIVDPAAHGKMKSGITRAVMRLDGFVSADAGVEGGELITRPLTFVGDRLEVNLDTSAGGAAWVELLDEKGRPIPGFTKADASVLCGNSVRMPVSWGKKQSVAAMKGKPVKIHFILKDCKLYAFQFK